MSTYDSLKFAPVLITDVFEKMNGSNAWYDKSKLATKGDSTFPFVSRTKASNGVAGFCSQQEKPPEPGNALIIGLDTQTVAYQPVPFYTGQNIQVLRHPKLSPATALVLAACIKEQMGKFSWGGNGATLGRLKKTRIMVPVVTGDNGAQSVDWTGMDRLGEELTARALTHAEGARATDATETDSELPELVFEPMLITNVFQTMKAAGKWFDYSKARIQGTAVVPYVARSGGGNGIGSFLPHQGFSPPNAGNAITIGVSTSTVFYQPSPFYTSKEIQVLRHPQLDMNTGQMLVTILREQMHKFAWGNGASLERLKATRIMVPVVGDPSGEKIVDWNGMARYGRILRARAERNMPVALSGSHPQAGRAARDGTNTSDCNDVCLTDDSMHQR